MKTTLLLLLLSAIALRAQSNTPIPGTADSSKTNTKPDIKVLFTEGSVFTNAAGLLVQKISPSLWATRTEVTQEAYKNVTGGNPSAFQAGDHPVESVSWNAAAAFCEALTAYEKKKEMLPDGFAYTLPTQAQWEMFAAGTTLEDSVTSQKTPRRSTEPVGSLAANALQLQDVRGNVWEWTADKNPSYDYRIARGGAWNTSLEAELRPEFRVFKNPSEAANNIGFRVILVPEKEAKLK